MLSLVLTPLQASGTKLYRDVESQKLVGTERNVSEQLGYIVPQKKSLSEDADNGEKIKKISLSSDME